MNRLNRNISHILLAWLLYPALLIADEPSSAAETVETLHHGLIEAMKTPESFSERYNQLAPVVNRTFDYEAIAKIILSRYWKDLAESEQENFVNLFSELSAATYAARFDEYDGESFEIIGTETLKKQRVVVKSKMIVPDSEAVRFDYILHQRENNWNIIAVIANGVNDLSIKRTEYGSIIDEEGFGALVANLEQKIRQLKTEES